MKQYFKHIIFIKQPIIAYRFLIQVLLFSFLSLNICAQNIGTLSTNKNAALLGEPITVTYSFNNVSNINNIPWPTDSAFAAVTLVKNNAVIINKNSVNKTYIITHFDSTTFKLPTINTKNYLLNKTLSVSFNYLPNNVIPDTLLPKYPNQIATGINSANINWKKYLLLFVVGAFLSFAVYKIFKIINAKKNKPQINTTIYQQLATLIPTNNATATSNLYNSLRRIIITSIALKTNKSISAYTQIELLQFINQNKNLVNKENILEVIAISNPILYGKQMPNTNLQKKHLQLTALFINENKVSNG